VSSDPDKKISRMHLNVELRMSLHRHDGVFSRVVIVKNQPE
jgi:hypothetical protein